MAGTMTLSKFTLVAKVLTSGYKLVGGGLASASGTKNLALTDTLADGSAIDCADCVALASGTIPKSGSVNLDLAGGTVDTIVGDAANIAKLKLLFVKNTTTTAGVTISLSGNFCTTAGIDGVVGPGGGVLFYRPDLAGYTVTPATGDTITLTNDSAVYEVDYEVMIAGVEIDVSSSSSSSSSSSTPSSSSSSTASSSSSSSTTSSASTSSASSSSSSSSTAAAVKSSSSSASSSSSSSSSESSSSSMGTRSSSSSSSSS